MAQDPNRIYLPDVRHSLLGPSGADRWMNCKGSNNIIRALGFNYSSTFAEEGTAAHAVLARCLMTGEAAWQNAGKIVVVGKNEYTVDEEMVEGVQTCIDAVAELRKEWPNGILFFERELSSVLDEEAYGAGDICFEVPGVAIYILDFKYGAGIVVEPTKPQMKMYGYYAYEMRGDNMRGENEPTKIICGVCQPRVPHPKGPTRWKTYDVEEVEEWFATTVLEAMGDTRNPNACLVVGEWCQMCPVARANRCPALFAKAETINPDLNPKILTGEELGNMIVVLERLKAVKDRCEEEAFSRAMTGEDIYNRKLVRKKANRIFRDHIVDTVANETTGEGVEITIKLEDAINLQFGLDAYEPPSLKTPPNIEKLPMGKEFVARWAYKPDTGLTLAPLTDSRQAVKPLMDRMDETAQPAEPGIVV